MEVIKHTPLSEVRALKKEVAEKEKQMQELADAKSDIELKFLDLMEVSATLYEEKLTLQEQNIQTMEAIAEIYEIIMGGN